MAFVYWIHLPEHDDPKSQGYIGITARTVEQRINGHWHSVKKKGSQLHVHRAMRKHGDKIKVTVLHEEDLELCELIEWAYRPAVQIAWNIGIGGDSPRLGSTASEESRKKMSASQTGRKHSEETKRKMSEQKKGQPQSEVSKINRAVANKEKVWTDEMRAKLSAAHKGKVISSETRAKISAAGRSRVHKPKGPRKGNYRPWKHINANKSLWADAVKWFDYFISTEDITLGQLAKYAGLPHSPVNSLYKQLSKGWNPLTDPEWLSFKCEYTKQQEALNDPTPQPPTADSIAVESSTPCR